MNSFYLIIHLVYFSYLFVVQTCATDSTGYKSYKNYKVYEVQGNQQEMKKLMDFLQENYEIPYHNYNEGSTDKFEVLVAPEVAPAVEGIARTFRLSTKTLVNDFSQLMEDEKATESGHRHGYSFKAYHNVDTMYAYMQNLSQRYPDMAQMVMAGESYEGRPIMGLRIGRTPLCPHHGGDDDNALFLESGIHGRDWIAPATTMYFMNELLTNSDPNISSMREAFNWYIFPVVNPDGYQYSYTTIDINEELLTEWQQRWDTSIKGRHLYQFFPSVRERLARTWLEDRMWRKTRSKSANGCYGADMNRNFDYNFMQYGASSNPCDYSSYAGSAPFSEKESRSLANYVSGIENLLGYITFHGNGQSLRFPYSDSDERVDNYNELKEMGETSLRYGYAVNHQKYRGPSSGAEMSYKVSGSSMDWARKAKNVPIAFTYHLGPQYGISGFIPRNRIPALGGELTQMMVGLTNAARDTYSFCDPEYDN